MDVNQDDLLAAGNAIANATDSDGPAPEYESETAAKEQAAADGAALHKQQPDTTRAHAKKGISVRLFETRDRDAVRALGRQHHANTIFRDLPFSDAKVDRQMDRLLKHPQNSLAIVAEVNGKIVGFASAHAGNYALADGPPLVTVQVIAVEREAIGPARRAKVFLALTGGARKWAKSMASNLMIIAVTTGTELDSTRRLVRSAGASLLGENYILNAEIRR